MFECMQLIQGFEEPVRSVQSCFCAQIKRIGEKTLQIQKLTALSQKLNGSGSIFRTAQNILSPYLAGLKKCQIFWVLIARLQTISHGIRCFANIRISCTVTARFNGKMDGVKCT